MRLFSCVAACALILSTLPADALDRAAFRREFGAFVDAAREGANAPPGFAVIVTDGDRVLFEGAYGVRNLAAGAPMTLDTPIISASISKSHTALLATRLDAAGILSLDATLADVWPDLSLPAPLDPRAITVRSLLSHQSGLRDDWLNLRAITAGNVALADVPGHLSRYAATTEPGFQYSNFGPYLYSMMVEKVTGRDWRDVMEQYVFRPMRLTRTTIRLTDLPESEIARCHVRQSGGWTTLSLDAPQSLNAAGGIHTSVRDASRFVRAFASERRATHGIPRAQYSRTLERQVSADGDLAGFIRDGYALGWDLSSYNGERYISRSGGYPGCRSLIVFSEETGITVTAFGVGDAGVNLLLFNLAKQAFDLASERADMESVTQARLAELSQGVAAAVARSDGLVFPDLTQPADPAPLRAYAGVYQSDLAGRMDVQLTPTGLVMMWNVFHMPLLPGESTDAFNAYGRGSADATPVTFTRDASGEIVSLTFWGETLARVR